MKKIGVILISSDYTFIQESTVFCNNTDGVFIYSIIPCDNNINMNSLLKLENKIKKSVLEFPKDIYKIAFGCTCASVVIGPNTVRDIIHSVYPHIHVITPITAALEAMGKLNVSTIGLVSPYIKEIEQIVIEYLQDNGINVIDHCSFNQKNDYVVSKIKPDKIADAIFSMSKDCDAVFVSCTNMKFLEQLDDIEKELGKPIISSNQAIIWAALKCQKKSYGKLFS